MVNNVVTVGIISYIRKEEKYTSFSVATKDRKGNTDFIPITVFSQTKEFFDKYFKVGKWISVIGRLTCRNVDGKFRINVIAEQINFCGKKEDEQETMQEPLYDFASIDPNELLPFEQEEINNG